MLAEDLYVKVLTGALAGITNHAETLMEYRF